ncbi:carboxypeptidase-like regulatory domain-containing protein [Flavobacteriaceae bacterium TP-CH-4]|uniref:Carboxypeptidase-like regulatory domain-containing protein n=1 Tax=Pelagihabitans pacificus TaxID=2696054 RepID=A0A967AVJ2_9FLAO|nr:carboxypeptidase-like regulatory domain-containing protein [Pelagihabitans pacificus]NHF60744.1 carboxypeptidase-like regulatory domain-containing protein [Pelagihabitans pacificus]
MRVVLTIFLFLLTCYGLYGQRIAIVDSLNQEPIPFATISFGDGLGTFADDEGIFLFSTKRYSDVDTLYISAMGYAEKAVVAALIPSTIRLRPEVSQLSEVVVSAPKEGKFKMRRKKAITHDDLFACWLPTVESEVAVFFERIDDKPTRISKLLLPINAESQYKSKGKGDYPTVFRIQFYENDNGLPGNQIGYEEIVFAINYKEDKVYELEVASKSIFIPETGIYASLQVLGYANKEGRLAQTKKYREVRTPRGTQKISTSFRPLLPFTKGLPNENTYVRRVFLNNKKWQVFDKTYNKNSKLIQTGNRNYGMGAAFEVYEN